MDLKYADKSSTCYEKILPGMKNVAPPRSQGARRDGKDMK